MEGELCCYCFHLLVRLQDTLLTCTCDDAFVAVYRPPLFPRVPEPPAGGHRLQKDASRVSMKALDVCLEGGYVLYLIIFAIVYQQVHPVSALGCPSPWCSAPNVIPSIPHAEPENVYNIKYYSELVRGGAQWDYPIHTTSFLHKSFNRPMRDDLQLVTQRVRWIGAAARAWWPQNTTPRRSPTR
jgi:hypothetical protein